MEDQIKRLRIDFTYPEDLQSKFVQNIIVQHQSDFFVVSFFEVWPPAILGDTEAERRELVGSIGKVEAKCVARLVLTPEKMREFVSVMKRNLENYEATFGS